MSTELFCSPFDEHLARRGPGAVFLHDPEGRLRFDAEWTRDAYARSAGGDVDWRWVLARDRASGYVLLALVTAADLVGAVGGGRLDVRPYERREDAVAALSALGRPPVAQEAW